MHKQAYGPRVEHFSQQNICRTKTLTLSGSSLNFEQGLADIYAWLNTISMQDGESEEGTDADHQWRTTRCGNAVCDMDSKVQYVERLGKNGNANPVHSEHGSSDFWFSKNIEQRRLVSQYATKIDGETQNKKTAGNKISAKKKPIKINITKSGEESRNGLNSLSAKPVPKIKQRTQAKNPNLKQFLTDFRRNEIPEIESQNDPLLLRDSTVNKYMNISAPELTRIMRILTERWKLIHRNSLVVPSTLATLCVWRASPQENVRCYLSSSIHRNMYIEED